MGYLTGKRALMMFDKYANLKYKFGNQHFWAEGYYVSTVGLNEETIKKYIQEQEKITEMNLFIELTEEDKNTKTWRRVSQKNSRNKYKTKSN